MITNNMACSGPRLPERMFYALRYRFSFFPCRQKLESRRLVFNFPERSGNHAENLRLPKHPTMMSRVDHDIAMVG